MTAYNQSRFYREPPFMLRGRVTFAAGTTGAVAQHTIFTITGMIKFGFLARVVSDLSSGGAATISHGNAGAVTALGAATTATTLDTGDFLDPGSTTWREAATFGGQMDAIKSSSGTDITADILVTTITGGVIEYVLLWTPLSAGATVTMGSELVVA